MAPPADDRSGAAVVLGEPPVAHQHHAGRPVGDLGDIVAAEATLHDRVGFVVGQERLRRQRPRPGLGVGVVLRVAQVEFTDGPQVLLVDAVATVVFTRHPLERIWPEELDALGLVPDPRCRRLHRRCRTARHGLLLLDPEHQHTVVAAGFDLGHAGQNGHRRRRTRGLVPHRRHAPQRRLDGRRHGTEVPLAGVELAEGIADMDALDGVGTDLCIGQGCCHDLGGEVGDIAVGLGQIVGEVGLMDSEDVGHGWRLQRSRNAGLTTLPTGLRGRASISSSRSGSL